MPLFPDYFQDWLFDALALQPGDELCDELLEPLHTLHRGLMASDAATAYADDPAAMRSYACFYMPINMPKLWRMLDRCGDAVTTALANGPVTVTELGCGPGTFLWALLFYLRSRRPDLLPNIGKLIGVDRSPVALKLAGKFAESIRRDPLLAKVPCEFVQGDWREHSGNAGIVITGNVLNEADDTAITFGTPAEQLLIIIEPGTAAVFQQILPLRQQLIDDGFQINFPCPSRHACPLAADNWCHFHINRFELPLIQRMANRLRRQNERHHFIGFVFSGTTTNAENQWRVLSRLRRVHRSGIRYICDGRHVVEAVLGRRDKATGNAAFAKAAAGDRILMDGPRDAATFAQSKHIRSTDRIDIVD